MDNILGASIGARMGSKDGPAFVRRVLKFDAAYGSEGCGSSFAAILSPASRFLLPASLVILSKAKDLGKNCKWQKHC